MKQLTFLIILTFFSLQQVFAQTGEKREKITLDGEIVTALITEDNDTILIADLDDVSITMPRKFNSREEYRLYRKYRKYANDVYPYAVESIKIFREVEYVTNNMKKRKRKRHIRRLQKQYKKEFKDPLKNLSKTQGMILTKMIEKELDRPFYDLLKELRGGFTAGYWNQLGNLYGYDLDRGYVIGDDPILDIVLSDYNISHEVDDMD